jgi:hypothetical protein
MGLVAVLAFSGLTVSISSASMTLPVFSGTVTGATGSSGNALLLTVGDGMILCDSSGEDRLVFEGGSRHLGAASIIFAGCGNGERDQSCSSLGASFGTIEATGTWHLVLRTVSSVDSHLLLFLVSELHIECPGASFIRLFLLTGDVAGLIRQVPGTREEFEFTVMRRGEHYGQEYSEFENEAGTGVKTSLKATIEGKTTVLEAFMESEKNRLDFESTTSIEK